MFLAAKQTPEEDNSAKRVDERLYYEARNKTKRLVRSGVMLCFIWLALILARLIPNVSLSFRILAAFVLLVAVLHQGLKQAAVIFFASVLLSGIYPGFLFNLPYSLFFGPYVLFAFLLNKYWKSKFAVGVRMIAGILLLLVLALVYGDALLPAELQSKISDFYWPLLILVAAVGTAIFDYLLGLFSLMYEKYLAPQMDK